MRTREEGSMHPTSARCPFAGSAGGSLRAGCLGEGLLLVLPRRKKEGKGAGSHHNSDTEAEKKTKCEFHVSTSHPI